MFWGLLSLFLVFGGLCFLYGYMLGRKQRKLFYYKSIHQGSRTFDFWDDPKEDIYSLTDTNKGE
jgi:hypothetical protein